MHKALVPSPDLHKTGHEGKHLVDPALGSQEIYKFKANSGNIVRLRFNRRGLGEPKRWLSDEHWMLSQRIWVSFSAPAWWLITICYSSSGGSDPQAQTWAMHPSHKIIIIKMVLGL